MASVQTNSRLPLLSVTEYADLKLRRLVERVNQLTVGRMNVVGELTLVANVASTTFEDAQFGVGSAPLLIPTTANAAAEVGAGGFYLSNRTAGAFTVTHANNAQTDRTFLYVRIG